MKQIVHVLLFITACIWVGVTSGRLEGERTAEIIIREYKNDLVYLSQIFERTISHGIIIKPERLDTLKAGATYEITPDSSTRRYWLLVEPDTTEFSNLK